MWIGTTLLLCPGAPSVAARGRATAYPISSSPMICSTRIKHRYPPTPLPLPAMAPARGSDSPKRRRRRRRRHVTSPVTPYLVRLHTDNGGMNPNPFVLARDRVSDTLFLHHPIPPPASCPALPLQDRLFILPSHKKVAPLLLFHSLSSEPRFASGAPTTPLLA